MDEKIKSNALSFPVEFEKINDYAVEDERFTKVKIWLMHTGLNKNNGYFEKSVVQDAIDTVEYIPVVGFLKETFVDGKDFTGHKYILTKDENGVRRKYIGHAYGVVLSNDDNNAHFEMRECDDGISREFLCVEAICWNVFEDAVEILDRDKIKKHSMELQPTSIEGEEDENGVFYYTKFSFRAACILGNDDKYEPAMQNSTIEVQDFTVTDFVKCIQDEISKKYVTFTKMVSENKDNTEKGGIRTMSAKTDFQTVMQQFNDISNVVSQFEVFEDRWGDAVPRYYVTDIQDNEVIVVDRKNNYQYVGLPFTMNGDKAEIDFTNGKRKKVVYEDYQEGSDNDVIDGAFDFGKHIDEIEKTAFEKVQEAESKVTEANEAKESVETDYTKIKEDYDAIKPKYDDFVKAEQEAEEKAIEDAKTSMFEKFDESLSENEDYKEIKENRNDFTVDEIEQKCAVLFTRMSLENKEQAQEVNTDFTKNETVGIMDDDSGADDGVNYVATKYGNIPTRR